MAAVGLAQAGHVPVSGSTVDDLVADLAAELHRQRVNAHGTTSQLEATKVGLDLALAAQAEEPAVEAGLSDEEQALLAPFARTYFGLADDADVSRRAGQGDAIAELAHGRGVDGGRPGALVLRAATGHGKG